MATKMFNTPKKSTIKLSTEQTKAVQVALPTVVLAAAGTGKTTTMIERISKANKQDNIELSRIFVSTFSKHAAQDMTNRLITTLNDSPQYIGTFHRNCVRLYKSHPILLTSHGYSVDRIKFATAADCEKFISDELEKNKDDIEKFGLKIREVKSAFRDGIDFLKGRGIYPINHHSYTAPKKLNPNDEKDLFKKLKGVGTTLNTAHSTGNLTMKPFYIFWHVYTKYQESLKNINMLDFNDVIALPVFAMRDKNICSMISSKFDLVVIDEFQDCSHIQYELIEKLSNSNKNAYLVGDEDQLLYEWRDASLSKVMDFYNSKTFNTCLLEENYRSQKPIVDFAVEIITKNKNRSSKVMKAKRNISDPNDVYFFQPYDDRYEAFFIAKKIKEILDGDSDIKDVSADDIAIIFATRYYRNNIEKALHDENIDYNFVKGYGFYEYFEVKKVMSYLSLALDYSNDEAFKEIFNYPPRRNASVQTNKTEKAAKIHNCSLFEAIQKDKTILNYHENKTFVDTIKRLRSLMKNSRTPIEVLEYLEDQINMSEKLVKEHGELEAKDRMSRIDQLASLLEDLLYEFDTYEEALEELYSDMFSVRKEVMKEKVQLMTSFASKGLEFKVVFIIGAIDGTFPTLKPGGNLEADRRVFYVACTRAKDLLFISAPKYLHKSGTTVECKPSRFLDGLDNFYEALSAQDYSEFEEYIKKYPLKVPSGEKFVAEEELQEELYGN